jgi:hypothetical protein
MKKHIAKLEKESLISPTGMVNWGAISEAAKNWADEEKEETLKLAVRTYMGDAAQDVSIKNKDITLTIQLSKTPQTYGVIDSNSIDTFKQIAESI